jgi:RNase H-like domain found in reverse transcriptase
MIFPTTQKQMQSFLGAANFFHTHIPNYASWTSSLYEYTAADFSWKEPTWTKDYRALFNLFEKAIEESITLHFPDYSLQSRIRSESSDHAVGAVLFQEHGTSPDTSLLHFLAVLPLTGTRSRRKPMHFTTQSLNLAIT